MQFVINLKRIKAKEFMPIGTSLCNGCIFYEKFGKFDCQSISNITGTNDCEGYIFVLKHKGGK